MNVVETKLVRRTERDDQIESPHREHDAGGRANQRENQTFGHKLRRESDATRAQRSAHAKFALSRGAAREQKSGDVRARDEEHARDGAEKHIKIAAIIADPAFE